VSAGSAEQESESVPVKPFCGVAMIVIAEDALPRVTDTVAGAAVSAKVGVGVMVVCALNEMG